MKHSGRAHSKFSASGSERWLACPGSVELSEGLPDKDSVWSIEGTKAHEVLEGVLQAAIQLGRTKVAHVSIDRKLPPEMGTHAVNAANFILGVHQKHPLSDILVETRIHLKFIHPEMFGTFDGAVVDHFGTLHVFDYKYGAGHAVSPMENLQMIFYGMGLAHEYGWNFKKVRLWVIQPRIKGYDGPTFWDLTMAELRSYVPIFRRGVERVLKGEPKYAEGSHCHWCKAKGICPLKTEGRLEKAIEIFGAVPLQPERKVKHYG